MGLLSGKADFVPAKASLPRALEAHLNSQRLDRNFLIISAPFGPFSRFLARRLELEGATCSRVILNGGDLLDWGARNAIVYNGRRAGWPAWLQRVIAEKEITDLILYGDSSFYCSEAVKAAQLLNLKLHVFEQGYFRPFWITLERGGVNGNSQLSKRPDDYREESRGLPSSESEWLPPLTPAGVRRITAYHACVILSAPLFPFYRADYAYSAFRQMLGHIVGYVRHRLFRRGYLKALAAALNTRGPLYIALLQRPGDSQLVKHSPFPKSGVFIGLLIKSFALNAPANGRLIFKAHPLDHGLENHAVHIRREAEAMGVSERVFFSEVGELNEMLKSCAGVITVNSTGGLAAIEHGLPTMVVGSAIYDLPGLVHTAGLDAFWRYPEAPDPDLFEAYRRVVMARTQINGAYATMRGIRLAAPEAARRLLDD
jgi:capsular polysaccharide export protein